MVLAYQTYQTLVALEKVREVSITNEVVIERLSVHMVQYHPTTIAVIRQRIATQALKFQEEHIVVLLVAIRVNQLGKNWRIHKPVTQ